MPAIAYPALAVLLFSLMSVLPVIGIVTGIFAPLVLLLYLSHPQRTKATDFLVPVPIAVLAFIYPVAAVLFVISPLFTAFFIRYCNRNNLYRQWLPSIGGAVFVFVVIALAVFGIPSYQQELIDFVVKTIQTFMEAMEKAGAPAISTPYYQQVAKQPEAVAKVMVMLFPAYNFIYTAIAGFISLNLFAKVKRLELDRFRLPDNIVWVLILGFALIFLQSTLLKLIGLNIALIFMTLYTFQGFEVLSYWLNKFKLLPIIKTIIFIFIFSEPPLILVISLVGLFSIWFNFYGKQKDEEQEKSE